MDLSTPDGIKFFCLPDHAVCLADPEKRSPEDLMYCPVCRCDREGLKCIPGTCSYYEEE